MPCGIAGLACSQRSGTTAVPGCTGIGRSNYDYCTDEDIAVRALDSSPGANGKDMTLCQGDCDADTDCRGDLVCFQSSGVPSIPGCHDSTGAGVFNYDYCNKAPRCPASYTYSRGVDCGPKDWGSISRVCGTGKSQSPIDIATPANLCGAKKHTMPVFPVTATTYTATPCMQVFNNGGHTFQCNRFTAASGLEKFTSSIGNLVGLSSDPISEYALAEVHFHFASEDDVVASDGSASGGSEHTLDGKSYPAEAHLVHYNTKYASKGAAVAAKDRDGLLVITVLFKVGDRDSASAKEFAKITGLMQNPKAPFTNLQSSPAASFNPGMLIPTDKTYAAYSGGMTSPPCSEKVAWIVLTTPAPISLASLQALQGNMKLKSGTGVAGEHGTYRPTQPLNGRTVFTGAEGVQSCATRAPPVTGPQVAIQGFAFVPASEGRFIVSAGDTVTWTNKDSAPHSVRFANKDGTTWMGEMMLNGESWSYKIPDTWAGETMEYDCGVHGSSMPGSITVKGAVTIKDFVFSPSPLKVAAGDTVEWTNQDNAPHSVRFYNADGTTWVGDMLMNGDRWSYTIPATWAGQLVKYDCGVHGAAMPGSIIVDRNGADDATTKPAVATTAAAADPETTAAAPSAGKPAVTIKQFKFVPSPLAVSVGDVVTWTNEDNFPHSVRIYAPSGVTLTPTLVGATMQLGDTYSWTVPETWAGLTVDYDCGIHGASMPGQLVVAAGVAVATTAAAEPVTTATAPYMPTTVTDVATATAADDAKTTATTPSGSALVVTIKRFKFLPSPLAVSVGDVVTWTNEDNFPHSVRIYAPSGVTLTPTLVGATMQLGDTYSWTVPETWAGLTVDYDCGIHGASMPGQLVVKGGSGASGTSAPAQVTTTGQVATTANGVQRRMDFCKGYTQNCVDVDAGAFAPAYENCMAEVAAMPEGVQGAITGNSFACREYHLSIGLNVPGERLAFHCPHASATGGGVCEDERTGDENGALSCNTNGKKDPLWGSVRHAGGMAMCTKYANDLNLLLVDCGRKIATRPNKGFSCQAAGPAPLPYELGTVASAQDCRGLVKFLTKALKKIQKKPVIKFVCEATKVNQTEGFLRIKTKSVRKCPDYIKKTNELMGMFIRKEFTQCTAPTPKPSPVLTCLKHQTLDIKTDVLQSSDATCQTQAAALSSILDSCGLPSKYQGSLTCSGSLDGSKMIVPRDASDEQEVKLTTRTWNKALREYKEASPIAQLVGDGLDVAYSNARKCYVIMPYLNDMIANNFKCAPV